MVYVTFLLVFVLVLVNVRLLANFVVLGGTLVLVLGRVESVAHYKERSIHSWVSNMFVLYPLIDWVLELPELHYGNLLIDEINMLVWDVNSVKFNTSIFTWVVASVTLGVIFGLISVLIFYKGYKLYARNNINVFIYLCDISCCSEFRMLSCILCDRLSHRRCHTRSDTSCGRNHPR